MSLRWIRCQAPGESIAIDGEYRFRIRPDGLMCRLTILRGVSGSRGVQDWKLLHSERCASVLVAKRLAERFLDAGGDSSSPVLAAQGGL